MKTLLELEERDCRWPIMEPEDYPDQLQRFCATRRKSGGLYCVAHRMDAFLPRKEPLTAERVEALAA